MAAGKLLGSTTLGGWLHRHTCFVARTVMRGERRRLLRERQAAEMNALYDRGVLAEIAPILDEAIQELGPDDRDAILLRFFEERNLRSVGEALGVNENVAQKRVSRAVQELAILLQRRGAVLSAAALTACLAGVVIAAPPGLALSIAGSVFAGVGTAGAGLTVAKFALMAKLKMAIASGIVLAAVLTTILLYRQHYARTRTELQLAQRQAEELTSPPPESLAPASQPIASSKDPGLSTQFFNAPRDSNPTSSVFKNSTRRSAPPVESPTPTPTPPIQRFAAPEFVIFWMRCR